VETKRNWKKEECKSSSSSSRVCRVRSHSR